MHYVKIFSNILDSTIWCEKDYTRLVWVTMLVMAERNGMVHASVPGLANRARVTIDECINALTILQEPDEHSTSKDYEGRRIELSDGGWRILNKEVYRKKMSDDARREYQRNWLANKKKKKQESTTRSVEQNRESTQSIQADAEASAKEGGYRLPSFSSNKNLKKKKKDSCALSHAQEGRFNEFWALYPKKKDKDKAQRWWATHQPDEELFTTIMKALKWQIGSDDWIKEGGQFISYPATWLNNKRWEDEEMPSDDAANAMLARVGQQIEEEEATR